MIYDYIIIGGGIVGVSAAWQMQQLFPKKKVLLLEKAPDFAKHQTGHNSGVIHAGVYYQPGSMKAEFSRRGAAATKTFCDQNNIPYIQCGKLLVATNSLEMERMQALIERCRQNMLDIEILDSKQLRREEPNITGLGGILVKTTGIIDYQRVTKRMADHFIALNGNALLEHEVTDIRESETEIRVFATHYGERKVFRCRFLITCAGLQSDRIVRMMNIPTDFQIIPFRGEYYELANNNDNIIKHLIYPIPDPDLPFLGVHLTRMIDGSVTIGPNAVLGWKREGYGRINIDIKDVRDTLTFPGFWAFFKRHYKTGILELKDSLWPPGYLKLVQKYCPGLRLSDLNPYPAGIRAQAILKDGSMVHDFLFAESEKSLHVCNAPSPAATSAIPIGEYICKKVAEKIM
jgi:L-2-hydroxyglutarate oxidase